MSADIVDGPNPGSFASSRSCHFMVPFRNRPPLPGSAGYQRVPDPPQFFYKPNSFWISGPCRFASSTGIRFKAVRIDRRMNELA